MNIWTWANEIWTITWETETIWNRAWTNETRTRKTRAWKTETTWNRTWTELEHNGPTWNCTHTHNKQTQREQESKTFVLFLSHTPARFYLSVELGFIVCFLHFMHICHAWRRHYSTLCALSEKKKNYIILFSILTHHWKCVYFTCAPVWHESFMTMNVKQDLKFAFVVLVVLTVL